MHNYMISSSLILWHASYQEKLLKLNIITKIVESERTSKQTILRMTTVSKKVFLFLKFPYLNFIKDNKFRLYYLVPLYF